MRGFPIVREAIAVRVPRCGRGLQLRPAADFRRRVDDFARAAADAFDDARVSRVAFRPRRTSAGEEFGEARLLRLLEDHRNLSADDLQAKIPATVAEFSGSRWQDDATLLVLAVRE